MVKVKSNIQTSSIYLRLRIEQIDERTQGRAQNNPQKRYKRQCLIHFGHFPNPGVPDFHELLLTIRMCHKLKANKAIIQRRKKERNGNGWIALPASPGTWWLNQVWQVARTSPHFPFPFCWELSRVRPDLWHSRAASQCNHSACWLAANTQTWKTKIDINKSLSKEAFLNT